MSSTTNASTTENRIPTAKLAALSRFKSFAGGLSHKKESKIVFPPPSWNIDDDGAPSRDAGDAATNVNTGVANTGDEIAPVEEDTDVPEPTTFAMKIKHMIESLPIPASVAATVGLGQGISTSGSNAIDYSTVPKDGTGPQIPDVVDPQTMRLLSSEDVMNGDADGQQSSHTKGTRQSVWAALDRLRYGNVGVGEKEGPQASAGVNHDEGVMMYSPLVPTPDSEVELAESELEYVDPEETPGGGDGTSDKKNGKVTDSGPPPLTKAPTLEKHWYPSTTKLSLLTTWWGYRLYLPPPVMATLGSNHMKATKRAAMITTALQWFLNKVPLLMMPPQVRGVVALLRRLTPLVGYIGIFIAWSWTRISACDKGNGVVLTATWLLPVALIPMAWDAGDIHGPSNRPPTPKGVNVNEADKSAVKEGGNKLKKKK